MGSILSNFHSVLKSAATLFSLDVYETDRHLTATGSQVRRSGQICSCVVAVLAVLVAPFAFYGQEGVFSFFQELNGVYFIPLAAVILVGLFNRWADGRSALITLSLGLVLMVVGTFFNGGDEGWLVGVFGSSFHYMGAVFAVLVALQLTLAKSGLCRDAAYEQVDVEAVDLTPWRWARVVGGVLCLFAVSVYVFFAV